MAGKVYQYVNTAHPQQDICTTRLYRPGLYRFKVAAELVPMPTNVEAQCLELGGGMAEFSQKLAESGYKVTFADLSPNNVAHAQGLGFESHQIDFNFGLPGLQDASFDLVVMLEVIEHIVNAEHLLAEVRRVLKPGGALVLSTPNFAWLYNRLRILIGQLSHDEGYHYRFFTRASLGRQLRSAGFEPEVWKFSGPVFGVNVLRRVLLRKSRIHVLVPAFIGTLLGQTLYVRGRAGNLER